MRKPIAVVAALALAACPGGNDVGGAGDEFEAAAELEPNGTTDEAQSLAFGEAVLGTISGASDVDHYRIVVPDGGASMRIWNSDATGTGCVGIAPDLYVLRSDGTTYGWPGTGACDDYTIELAAGTWYLQVKGGTAFEYALHVRAAGGPEVSESEPNDDGTVAQATLDFAAAAADGPFTAPTVIAGAISPRGDDDFYAVRNDKSHPVLVHLETYATWSGAIGACPFPTDPTLDIYAADGTLLAHRDRHGISSDCEPLEHELAPGATIYVRVTGHDDIETISAYRLLVDL